MSNDNVFDESPEILAQLEHDGIDLASVEIEPVSATRKEQDLALWKKWNQTKSKTDLSALLKSLKGVIQKEVNRASGSLPVAVLEGAAMRWAIEAIKRYNPNSNAALATWVTGYLQKVRRLNYQHQNMVRLPEEKQREFFAYNQALGHLRETLTREPTDHELASHLEWKPAAVTKYKSMLFNDHYESGSEMAVEAHTFDFDKIKFDFILEQLDPQEKMIMENLMKADKQRLGNSALASKMGVNENRLSYLKTKLKTKVRSLQKQMGD